VAGWTTSLTVLTVAVGCGLAAAASLIARRGLSRE
jgi:hypothetical protein